MSGGDFYPLNLGALPPGWVSGTVGEFALDVRSGFASGVHNEQGIGVVQLRPMNIDREGRLDLSIMKSVPPANPLRVTKGDVLFNNTNSPELIGKTTAIPREGDWAYSNHMTRLRFPPEIDPGFVAHQLHFLWMARYFRHRCVNHVNQASISGRVLSDSVPLVVAPSAEQRRIVAEIEKQLTRLDAGVEALKRLQIHLKRYRASVLKAACEGRLVPTEAELARRVGRDYAPAHTLLARNHKERRAKWEADQRAKMKTAGKTPKDDSWKTRYGLPVDPGDSNAQLPEGWTWTTLGQAFRVAVGATPSRSKKSYWNGDVPWVSSGEVAFCRIRSTRERITAAGLDNTSTEIHPPGTVLIGMIGEGKTRGQVAILEIYACNNQNSAAIRVSEAGLPPEYVYRFLEGEYERTRRVGSGNNQPALNKSKVEAILLPLPPLAEQLRISAELERKLSELDRVETGLLESVAKANRLRQSILKRAFEGKLVLQDPSDEPASILLGRLRSTRQAALPPGPSRRRAVGERA